MKINSIKKINKITHRLIMYLQNGCNVWLGRIGDYIRQDLSKFLNENDLGDNKATLYLDSAPWHLIEPIKDAFKEICCNSQYIKKRCTNIYQPFDVWIFAPIKRIKRFNNFLNVLNWINFHFYYKRILNWINFIFLL